MRKVFIPAGVKISDYEREHKVRFLGGMVTEDGVASDVVDIEPGYFVNVWNCQGTVVLWGENPNGSDNEYIREALYEYDEELYQDLIMQVVYEDNDGMINMSGDYYPNSQQSAWLFKRLMKTAKARQTEHWIPVTEAAELVHRERRTIHYHIPRKYFKSKKIGRWWFVEKNSLLNYYESKGKKKASE